MAISESKIIEYSLTSLCKICGFEKGEIKIDDEFSSEKFVRPVNDFRFNPLDHILDDIRFVADRKTLKDLNSGRLEIRTVRGFCLHMVKSYQTNPKLVKQALNIRD